MTKQEKKQKTRRALANAAVRLFTEQGFDEVTMTDIAASAGVSRRTAFRYFPSKADLLLEYPNEWRRVFDSSISENTALPLRPRFRRAAMDVAAHIEQDEGPVRLLFALALAHPTIAGRYAMSSQGWVERMYVELARDGSSASSDAQARMAAAAIMGIIDGACGMWAAGGGKLTDLLEEGLDLAESTLLARFEASNEAVEG